MQLRKGQAKVTDTPILPFTGGYDLVKHSEFGEYDPARAKGLLDTFGYLDRDGDGWRERPDGSPLLLEVATQSDQAQRGLDELFKKNMYPGVWRHGDWIRITPSGGAIIYGRSDATINRHGIRMGTAEL